MKRMLCLTLGNTNISDLISHEMNDWVVHNVLSLADAKHALRTDDYPVGLLVHGYESSRLAEMDSFLRLHSHMQWIGVFSRRDLESATYHDLIVEHLCDYHTFPIDPVRLAYTLGHAHGWAILRKKIKSGLATAELNSSPLIGGCEAMMHLRSQIERVAKVAAPVLIWGESGSGKELTAQAIHAQSDRVAGSFVPINCGAIAPSLIHSELFGYERGAFTGATRSKVGLIESAHGGTLFLDEIGDLPKEMQANLLRFLQEKTICRLGGTRNIEVDVRVVAASHVHLHQAVADGFFREDLYYRLAVLPVTVPSLRERRDDLVALAEHFFRLYASEKSPRLKGFSNSAIVAIREHDWPGNVRELINRVRRALVMSDARLIMPEDLGLGCKNVTVAPAVLEDSRARSERSALRESLDRSGQNVSRAARELGVSRTTIYRLLSKHGMRAS